MGAFSPLHQKFLGNSSKERKSSVRGSHSGSKSRRGKMPRSRKPPRPSLKPFRMATTHQNLLKKAPRVRRNERAERKRLDLNLSQSKHSWKLRFGTLDHDFGFFRVRRSFPPHRLRNRSPLPRWLHQSPLFRWPLREVRIQWL